MTLVALPVSGDIVDLALAALDGHWAVAAIPRDRRTELLHLAAHPGERSPADAEAVYTLATAYELAALGALSAGLPGAPPRAGSDADASGLLAREIVAHGAARAYLLHHALPLPVDEPVLAGRALLRLVALAVAGRRLDDLHRVLESDAAHTVLARLDAIAAGAPVERWEEISRATLWRVWVALLTRPDERALTEAVERLGRLRERRTDAERDFLNSLEGAEQVRARFELFALRGVAEAGELLAVAFQHRAMTDAVERLTLHFTVARSAAAGDHGLDLLLAWLHVAAVTTVAGLSDQLELPGL